MDIEELRMHKAVLEININKLLYNFNKLANVHVEKIESRACLSGGDNTNYGASTSDLLYYKTEIHLNL